MHLNISILLRTEIMWTVVILVVILAILFMRRDNFHAGGYQLGSYDPSRYASEITRTP